MHNDINFTEHAHLPPIFGAIFSRYIISIQLILLHHVSYAHYGQTGRPEKHNDHQNHIAAQCSCHSGSHVWQALYIAQRRLPVRDRGYRERFR